MTKRWALTYEYNWLKGYGFVNVSAWRSGREAVDYVTQRGKELFPRSNDSSVRSIPPNGEIKFGLGFRGINARYMSPEEIEIYQKYGNRAMVDQEEQTLVPPKDEEKQQ